MSKFKIPYKKNILSIDFETNQERKGKQDLFNKSLNAKAEKFIANELLSDIKENLSKLLKTEIEIAVDEKEKQVINFYYPKIYSKPNDYIKQYVRLEIGPLAAWTPSINVNISPYICESMPTVFEIKNTRVLTVVPERTFWEKATILHREANRPQEKHMQTRYARHYYDLYMFSKTKYFLSAIKNKDLLEKVVKFKTKFYRDNWANYDECLQSNLKLVPPDYRLKELEKDYAQMQEMFYGEIPTLSQILDQLKIIEKLINVKSKM